MTGIPQVQVRTRAQARGRHSRICIEDHGMRDNLVNCCRSAATKTAAAIMIRCCPQRNRHLWMRAPHRVRSIKLPPLEHLLRVSLRLVVYVASHDVGSLTGKEFNFGWHNVAYLPLRPSTSTTRAKLRSKSPPASWSSPPPHPLSVWRCVSRNRIKKPAGAP